MLVECFLPDSWQHYIDTNLNCNRLPKSYTDSYFITVDTGFNISPKELKISKCQANADPTHTRHHTQYRAIKNDGQSVNLTDGNDETLTPSSLARTARKNINLKLATIRAATFFSG